MERLYFAILPMITAYICSADILRFRVSKLADVGHEIKMDIVFDTVEQTGLYTPGIDSRSSCAGVTINLHDYRTKMLAVKQVETGKCFIRPSNETLLGAIEMIRREKMGDAKVLPVEHWKIDPMLMPYTAIKIVAGHNIAEFCRDYEAYNLTQYTSTHHKEKRCLFNCGTCTIVAQPTGQNKFTDIAMAHTAQNEETIGQI